MPRKKTTKVEKVTKKVGKEAPAIKADNAGLAQISELATLAHEAALNIARLEDEVAAEKDRLRRITEEDLPMAMIECDLNEFETTDGLKVTWKPEYAVNITNANKEAAYKWLNDNGFGGIIKLNVNVRYERGKQKQAQTLVNQLQKKGIDADVSQSIHHQTLKSFVRERMEDTESELQFPAKLFGAYPYNVAKVKPKKK